MIQINLMSFLTALTTAGIGILSEPVSAVEVCLSGNQREISGRVHWTTDRDDDTLYCHVIFPGGFRNRFWLRHGRYTQTAQRSRSQPFRSQCSNTKNTFKGLSKGGLYYETTVTTNKATENKPVLLSTDQDCESWYRYGEHQYCFINTKKTWGDADQNCRSYSGHNSHLAYIVDMTKNDFIEQFFIKMRQDEEPDVWIGLDDRFHEGTFKWGNEVATFTNWSEEHEEPNGGKGTIPDEDCVGMSTNFDGEWIDFECTTQLYSICEVDF